MRNDPIHLMSVTNNSNSVWVNVLGYWDDGYIRIFSNEDIAKEYISNNKKKYGGTQWHGPYEHEVHYTSEELL